VIERDDEREPVALPPEPIDRIGGPLARFLHIEAAADRDPTQPHPAESPQHGFLHGLFHRGR
jgi:hypothetical protein